MYPVAPFDDPDLHLKENFLHLKKCDLDDRPFNEEYHKILAKEATTIILEGLGEDSATQILQNTYHKTCEFITAAYKMWTKNEYARGVELKSIELIYCKIKEDELLPWFESCGSHLKGLYISYSLCHVSFIQWTSFYHALEYLSNVEELAIECGKKFTLKIKQPNLRKVIYDSPFPLGSFLKPSNRDSVETLVLRTWWCEFDCQVFKSEESLHNRGGVSRWLCDIKPLTIMGYKMQGWEPRLLVSHLPVSRRGVLAENSTAAQEIPSCCKSNSATPHYL